MKKAIISLVLLSLVLLAGCSEYSHNCYSLANPNKTVEIVSGGFITQTDARRHASSKCRDIFDDTVVERID